MARIMNMITNFLQFVFIDLTVLTTILMIGTVHRADMDVVKTCTDYLDGNHCSILTSQC